MRFFLRAIVYYIILAVLNFLFDNFISSYELLIGVALVLSLVNMTLRPLFQLIALPISIVTLGIGCILVNMITLGITNAFFKGFDINGFFLYFFSAILIMIGDTIVRKERKKIK